MRESISVRSSSSAALREQMVTFIDKMQENGADTEAESVERYMEAAEQEGVTLTRDEVMDELAADFAGDMLDDAALFAKFSKENRTAAQKLLDSLKEFLNKVRGLFTGKYRDMAAQEAYGKDFAELEDIAKQWQAAFDAAERQAGKTKTAAGKGDGARYMIRNVGGEKRPCKICKGVFWKDVQLERNGYITTDGTKLDFSGRHEGAPGGQTGRRGDGSGHLPRQTPTISIHAPREGGDVGTINGLPLRRVFQSTPPRRGRQRAMLHSQPIMDFNPRPPRGGRPRPRRWPDPHRHFNPRPPRGGATADVDALRRTVIISIHAPREGGDPVPHDSA